MHNFPGTGNGRITSWGAVTRYFPLLALLATIVALRAGESQELQWAVRAGGVGVDTPTRVAVDQDGNTYLTGGFSVTATFGPSEANQTTLVSAGNTDIFVAKFASNGALVWAKRAGGIGEDAGIGIAVDKAGNSYVAGRIRNVATFGPGEPNQTVITSPGTAAIFAAKFDPDGMLVWVTYAGGVGLDQGLGIGVDGEGNSYVSGGFSETATFGLGEANQTELISAGGPDFFLAKYDLDGALVWAVRAGGAGGDSGRAAADEHGNVCACGVFMEVATFGYGEPNETTLVSGGHWDIFVARYDSSGKLRWAKRAGGAGSDQGIGIAVDGEGGCFVTGVIAEAAVFAPGEANQTILMAEGSWDTFVARYDSNGVLHWVKQITGPAAIGGVGIATDWAGNSAVSGYFLGTATFAPGEGNQTTLTSFGNLDVFVAKYETGGGLAWVKRIGGPGPDQGAGVVFDSVGKIRVTGSFSETITFGAGETNETELTSTGGQDIFLAMYGASAGPSIEGLIDEITGLQDQGILAPGLESALIEKLEAAAASLGRGNVNAAAGQLRAFTNQVSALLRSGQLPAGAGQSLIDAANQILSACCS